MRYLAIRRDDRFSPNAVENDRAILRRASERLRELLGLADDIAMVDERHAKIKALEEKLAQAQSDYDSLKMAKMMTISDNDMEATQKRIAKLIRDVNKCITLLGEK